MQIKIKIMVKKNKKINIKTKNLFYDQLVTNESVLPTDNKVISFRTDDDDDGDSSTSTVDKQISTLQSVKMEFVLPQE